MKYDISKTTAPAMPALGKGTECIKLLLTQTSKDMHEPLVPMLFPALAAELLRIKVRRALCVVGIVVGLNHRYHPFCRSASAAPQWHFSVQADTEYP